MVVKNGKWKSRPKKSKNYFKHKFEIIEACTPYFLDTNLDPVA